MTTPTPDEPPAPTPAPAFGPAAHDRAALPRSTVTVARFADYAGAQQAVDYLSDNGFPVARTAIIGTDLRLVEHVLGRLTTGRAAVAGLAGGAWFGLFVGILFTLFSTANWVGILLTTIVIGALWGAVFGATAHAMTGGRRDFTSRSSLQAGEYAVTVEAEVAEEARVLITRMHWRSAN
ncbi:general stress protein [Dactylosporangium sp. NPDC051485]|uniref:general stress protein n=1 Tax=Dactylosporangium sp. NPDC051485 TaxID=3154846 RepID=UPI0034375E26